MNKKPEPKKLGRPRKVEKPFPTKAIITIENDVYEKDIIPRMPDKLSDRFLKAVAEQEVFTVNPEHKYEQHILKLQTMQGFYDEYISRLGYTSSNAEAYETTEVFFQAYFGKRRFKNYDSFRARMSQFQSEKK